MDGEYLPNIKDEPGFLSRLENTDVFLVCKNKNNCLTTGCNTEQRRVKPKSLVWKCHLTMDQNEEM